MIVADFNLLSGALTEDKTPLIMHNLVESPTELAKVLQNFARLARSQISQTWGSRSQKFGSARHGVVP